MGLTLATFTGCSRSVRAFSQQRPAQNQRDGYGLQIREDRFDSGTRLNDLADAVRGFSTRLSTFPFWSRSVRAAITASLQAPEGEKGET